MLSTKRKLCKDDCHVVVLITHESKSETAKHGWIARKCHELALFKQTINCQRVGKSIEKRHIVQPYVLHSSVHF